MALTSPQFLLLTAASVLLYYLLPGRFQWPLLLAAGLLFYCAGGRLTVLYVIAVALTVWASALLIEAHRAHQRLSRGDTGQGDAHSFAGGAPISPALLSSRRISAPMA